MRRGTTPTHTFTLPITVENCSQIRIIYSQRGKVLLKKNKEDMELDGYTVKTKLTQAETMKFDDKELVEIQVRAITWDDDSLVSDVFTRRVGRLLDDEVL